MWNIIFAPPSASLPLVSPSAPPPSLPQIPPHRHGRPREGHPSRLHLPGCPRGGARLLRPCPRQVPTVVTPPSLPLQPRLLAARPRPLLMPPDPPWRPPVPPPCPPRWPCPALLLPPRPHVGLQCCLAAFPSQQACLDSIPPRPPRVPTCQPFLLPRGARGCRHRGRSGRRARGRCNTLAQHRA